MQIVCPNSTCSFRFWLTREEINGYLLFKQFPLGYINLIWHEELVVGETSNSDLHVEKHSTFQSKKDPILNIINDVFGMEMTQLIKKKDLLSLVMIPLNLEMKAIYLRICNL